MRSRSCRDCGGRDGHYRGARRRYGRSTAERTDLAATTRTGIGTFTYPSTTAANMLFKIGDAQSGNTVADLQISGGDEVTSSGGTTPTITSTTTSTGASAIAWQQATAEANSWIQANPPALPQGDTYLLLRPIYLYGSDLWDGSPNEALANYFWAPLSFGPGG